MAMSEELFQEPIEQVESDSKTLPPELVRRAEIEVNEKEAWRERDIEALRELVTAESSLNSQTDSAFLLRFLRARRFDYDRALQLIKQYYYLQSNHQDLFVAPSKLKHVFDSNVISMLPNRTDNQESIFVFEAGKWNPRLYNFDALIAGCVASVELAVLDEVAQIAGLICVVNMAEFGWTQLRRFGPSQAKKVVHVIEECLPVRFKAIHVVNESTIADIAFAIIKPFLSEELRNKIIFHGSNLSSLHNVVSADILHAELGGSLGSFDASPWYEQLLRIEKELVSCWENYGINKGASQEFLLENGIIGSGLFRKSQTCNGYLFDYYKPSRAE